MPKYLLIIQTEHNVRVPPFFPVFGKVFGANHGNKFFPCSCFFLGYSRLPLSFEQTKSCTRLKVTFSEYMDSGIIVLKNFQSDSLGLRYISEDSIMQSH